MNIEAPEIKKKGGRPLGSLNRPKTEKKTPNRQGRPFIYKPIENDTTTPAKLTYQRRGFIINKITSLKRKYGLTEPTRDRYIGKPNDVALGILKEMTVIVSKLNEEKLFDKINTDYTARSNNIIRSV